MIDEESLFIEGWHRWRYHLRPGMTGPWQVLGSTRVPLEEMVKLDYLYCADWSLWGDVKILAQDRLLPLPPRVRRAHLSQEVTADDVLRTTVLVTGGAGFTGCVLTPRLLERRISTCACSTGSGGARSRSRPSATGST